MDRYAAVDVDAAVRMADHGIDLDVMFILNLTNNLFDEVFNRDDPLNASVLVHDHTQVSLRILQHPDGIVQFGSVWNENRFSEQLRKAEGLRLVQKGH